VTADQGSDAYRSGPLDHQLRLPEEQCHRVADLVLADHDDAIDVALDQRHGQRPGPLHRDPVGNRL
jgi:hypothetical protein